MNRPAYANLIDEDVDVVHVIGRYEEAKSRNSDGMVRYVAAEADKHYNWDWADGRTIVFHGRTHSQAPWNAIRAGARFVVFVGTDGVLRQWKRTDK